MGGTIPVDVPISTAIFGAIAKQSWIMDSLRGDTSGLARLMGSAQDVISGSGTWQYDGDRPFTSISTAALKVAQAGPIGAMEVLPDSAKQRIIKTMRKAPQYLVSSRNTELPGVMKIPASVSKGCSGCRKR